MKLIGFYDEREDFFEIGIDQQYLPSIINMFPVLGKDTGYMTNIKSRIDDYKKIIEKSEQKKLKKSNEILFLCRMYKYQWLWHNFL